MKNQYKTCVLLIMCGLAKYLYSFNKSVYRYGPVKTEHDMLFPS